MANKLKISFTRPQITRSDLFLILTLVFFSIMSFLWIQIFNKPGQWIKIYSVDKPVERVLLNIDRDINIRGNLGVTVLRIQDGSAWIIRSPCPQKLCMHMGKISRDGESLVCLPNKVMLLIEKNDRQQFDAITM